MNKQINYTIGTSSTDPNDLEIARMHNKQAKAIYDYLEKIDPDRDRWTFGLYKETSQKYMDYEMTDEDIEMAFELHHVIIVVHDEKLLQMLMFAKPVDTIPWFED